MKKCVVFYIGIFLGVFSCDLLANSYMRVESNRNSMEKILKKLVVDKKVLDNGMTVLVNSVHTIPKVSLQIWYNVGAKDEKTGEKGLAHLIEHMIFKGTQELLSESDINVLTHKLSGSCNAFTWYDYTGYLFYLPSHNRKKILPVIADCMSNCSFNDDHLNSEMKAVIQELKMRRDDYGGSLIEDLLTSIFADHPYHYPVIGYKQDLWSVRGKDLKKFYKEHYIPNNATLVVVGDVSSDHVFNIAQKYFGSIKQKSDYKRPSFYYNKDIVSKQVTFYRDVKQSLIVNAFVVPGFYEKVDHIIDLLVLILGSGKASRLYKKLVDELQLVTSISASSWNLFEYGLFIISFEPKRMEDVATIELLINEEIASIVKGGLRDDEMQRAVKKLQMQYYKLLEDMEQQAYKIGESFLATGDENYAFEYLSEPIEQLRKKAQNLVEAYMRPSIMHKGAILPLPKEEKEQWALLQQFSDQEDKKILSERIRYTPVEPPRYALTIEPEKAKKFHFPHARKAELSNGVRVLSYNNNTTPKINLILDLKAKAYYDPEDKQGLYGFVARMLSEGTSKYTATELAHEFESRGMSFSVYPGSIAISMLAQDLPKGLELLYEILTDSIFDEKCIEKVRTQILVDIKNFWDEPYYFAGQLLKEQIYKGHPYSKNSLGTEESIKSITRDDLVEFYKKYISPNGAKISIVGDFSGYNLEKELEQIFGAWIGSSVEDIEFPGLEKTSGQEINHSINRDQVTLCFVGLSINRCDKDYDKLLVFDQILGGGVLGSMSSRLFQLREQTGLFYTINGSLIANVDIEPGMIAVKTIVSVDRLQEAEDAIKETLKGVADTIEKDEFEHAKDAIINSLVNHFESNYSIASVFLFLDKYNLSEDYFDARAQDFEKITITQVKEAVQNVLDVDNLLTLRIGRV